MDLRIEYLGNLHRACLVKRMDGKYKQHAHFLRKKDAEKVIKLIQANKYPRSIEYQEAMKRLLTPVELTSLRKKTPYRNINKGVRR